MVTDLREVERAFAPQLKFPDHELERLATRIDEDYQHALSAHEARMRRFVNYYRRWRNMADVPTLGEEDTPNYQVPLIQWQVFAKWAKTMDSLFGQGAEVMVEPVGPSDQREVEKAKRFLQWRVFESMKLVRPAALFFFRAILFGRSHAYMPWQRDLYRVPLKAGGWDQATAYDGPGFLPLWPDDLMLPGEDAETIQDFSFVIRKFRATPAQLFQGEEQGTYQGITDTLQELIDQAEAHSEERDSENESIKEEMDEAEGVTRDSGVKAGGSLKVYAWYGKWRMLRGQRSARPENVKLRELEETDLLVHYLPELRRVIGVQNLGDMYPLTPSRRPFVECSLVKDGSYWNLGYGEMLTETQREISVTHNLGTRAGEFSVGPVIFYTADSGFDPDTFEYQPNTSVAIENPNGLKVVEFRADLTYPITKQQQMEADAERLTGQTDQNVGRQPDRANSPRTATQFVGLVEEGNVRAALDTTLIREDFAEILKRIWQLEVMYGAPNTFFRVTEEQAGGFFPVTRGGAEITAAEFNGQMDFQLKLATSIYSRETEKQRKLMLYQLDTQNPLILQAPRALWQITNEVHKALGDDNFPRLVPQPPDIELSIDPRQEWSRMLAGERLDVRPDDNDNLHLDEHYSSFEREQEAGEQADAAALDLLANHIQAHHTQKRGKELQAALVERLAERMAENAGAGRGLQPPGQAVGLEEVGQAIAELTGAGNNDQGRANRTEEI
jgi:hypothetical protein